MKTLHCMMSKAVTDSSGIFNQMSNELISAQKLNLNHKVKLFLAHAGDLENDTHSDLVVFYKLNSKTRLGRFIEHRKAYYSWLRSKENQVDCFILRFSLADPFQYYFIKKCSKPVLLVHHTKELDEMGLNGIKGMLLKYVDRVFGNLSIRKSKAIIGVTKEIIDYEKARIKDYSKESLLYPNGIYLSDNPDLNLSDKRSIERPEVLFIASYFYEWHGLDILIDQVAKSDVNILIHIVGKVSESDYNRLIKDDRFQMHGSLNKEQIFNLASQCWISLGSLALYRKNMAEACTLKVREYLSLGLPVYSSHQDIFPSKFSFYNYTEFSVDSLYEYAISMRNNPKRLVRDSAIEYISKEIVLQRFHDDISRLLKADS